MLLNNKSISYQRPAIKGRQTGKLLQTDLLRKLFTVHCSLFTDKKGITLVEVMIALVILLLVFLALMQTALVSIDANIINVLREEAISVADQAMNEARNIPFDTLADDGPDTVTRNVRNISVNYEVRRDVIPIGAVGADAQRIEIRVRWAWKEKTLDNDPYTHTISTIVRRQ